MAGSVALSGGASGRSLPLLRGRLSPRPADFAGRVRPPASGERDAAGPLAVAGRDDQPSADRIEARAHALETGRIAPAAVTAFGGATPYQRVEAGRRAGRRS